MPPTRLVPPTKLDLKQVFLNVDGKWVNVPWFYLFVIDSGGKSLMRCQTSWKGSICGPLKGASQQEWSKEAERLFGDRRFTVLPDKDKPPTLRALVVAEVEFALRGDGASKANDATIQRLLASAKLVSIQRRFANDVYYETEDTIKNDSTFPSQACWVLDLRSTDPGEGDDSRLPTYIYVNAGLVSCLTLLADKVKAAWAKGDGASKADLAKIKEKLAKLGTLVLGRTVRFSPGNLKGAVPPEPTGTASDGWGARNAFFQTSNASSKAADGKTGRSATEIEVHQELWSLAATVTPIDARPTPPDARALATRLAGKTESEKVAIFTSGSKYVSPPAGEKIGVWFGAAKGAKEPGLKGAILNALGAAAKYYRTDVLGKSYVAKGGAIADAAKMQAVFPRKLTLAAAAFTFATNHWLYDFNVTHIDARVARWWRDARAGLEALSGLKVYVDGYASAKGGSRINEALARRRMRALWNALDKATGSTKFSMGGVADQRHYHFQDERGVWQSRDANDAPVDASVVPWAGAGPGPECMQYVETYPRLDPKLVEWRQRAGEKNPWYHRVATLRICEEVVTDVTMTEDSAESYFARTSAFVYSSLLIQQATLLGYHVDAAKGQVYAWVHVVPGKEAR